MTSKSMMTVYHITLATLFVNLDGVFCFNVYVSYEQHRRNIPFVVHRNTKTVLQYSNFEQQRCHLNIRPLATVEILPKKAERIRASLMPQAKRLLSLSQRDAMKTDFDKVVMSASSDQSTTSMDVGSSATALANMELDLNSLRTKSDDGTSTNSYDSIDSSTVYSSQMFNEQQQKQQEQTYKNGIITIAFITLLFASNSPVLHAAYAATSTFDNGIPVLLLNAACSVVAMLAMIITNSVSQQLTSTGLSSVNDSVLPSLTSTNGEDRVEIPLLSLFKGKTAPTETNNLLLPIVGGVELGLWKFCGTLLNIFGLSLTSAAHGAFLIQLTTLFVPLVQGFLGVPIPSRIWTAIGLALSGVVLFTTAASDDITSPNMFLGDVACVGAAVMYATYDLRLFHWGKLVEPLRLITTKIVTQTALSMACLLTFALNESIGFIDAIFDSPNDLALLSFIVLWSGLAVNALAPYLQVGGQQAVGPARAQIIYASQPLWAALMSFVFLGETVTHQGMVGGVAFLAAVMLAATAPTPDPNCDNEICET